MVLDTGKIHAVMCGVWARALDAFRPVRLRARGLSLARATATGAPVVCLASMLTSLFAAAGEEFRGMATVLAVR